MQCAFPCRYNEYNELIRDGTFIWSNPDLTLGLAKVDLSVVQRRLLTHHGTVVFLDIGSGELGRPEGVISPGNVFIEVREAIGKGYFVHKVDDDRFSKIQVEPGLTPTPVRLHNSPSDTTQLWSLVSADGGAVGLLSGDLYLCAEPDGRMTLSRQEFGVWEQFLRSTSLPRSKLSS